MNDDFSDHPKTIGEIRSDKSQKAEHWSPRDALIAALREIDSGEMKVDSCVLVFGKIEKGGSETNIKVAGNHSTYVTLGLIERAKHLINADT